MTTAIDALAAFFWGYALIYGLLALGIFFAIRLGFLQSRHFPRVVRSALGLEEAVGGVAGDMASLAFFCNARSAQHGVPLP